MKTPVLIFDFDGTLADTFAHFIMIYNQLAEDYQTNKIMDHEIQLLKEKTTHQVIDHLRIPFRKVPFLLAKGIKIMGQYSHTIKPQQGLQNVLHQLLGKGVRMGILTSNSYENVKAFLQKNEIDNFSFISASSKIWSKNIWLKKLLAKQDLNKNDVLYVGDEIRDIKAAQKAGIKVAAVTWGYNSKEALSQHDPDYLINKPEELLSLLAQKIPSTAH